MCELAKVCFSLRLQEVHPSASALHAPLGHTLAQWVSDGVVLFWRCVCMRFLCSGFYVLGFAIEECGSRVVWEENSALITAFDLLKP